jgi:hypothetical protein
VQYLFNNLEDCKHKLIYASVELEGYAFQRGQVIAYEDFLNLPSELEKMKIPKEEIVVDWQVKKEPFQAEVFSRQELNYE